MPDAAVPRTGIGWDTHRLVAGRPLVLGGVTVPSELGLDGHSDADVLTHAVIDALLGAAGLGDIGEHFPDTDEAFRGADSMVLLRETVARCAAAGWRPVHADATVLLERPKLLPYKPAMRANLAAGLGVGEDAVNVKATRGEGMGPVGRGEGAVAQAVVTCVPV
ncbi:2-C-methyl-D-erythritol 2,4-cyclodiphosphate synthase [Paraconexibacter algicola]|uniref:2-C-methyl-D-erythritol 2,4-cyclodiphosphate synthase n=1 Tax=Paraconexibacter algicola TaxID=2133960 RepID=A0A2T4UFF4_9ACTN|nr:2-C-methyl-D-erythritol 2,4-cyclodiphosphate synthase [Paraconexibacter algicola]PTL56501.1 2-C-methyl-D-erythritol 2,4-cyclodiphosphate synthase [Paraconexibacter algicola]